MGVIGNTIGEVRYVDLPVAAGTDPTVSYTTDEVLDLIGIEVLAKGATAAALKVDSTTVAGGAISSFSNDRGAVHAAAPTAGVPTASAGGGAQQVNSTTAGNVNWQSSGTVQPVAVTLTTALTTDATTALAVSALPVALASGAFVTVGTDVFVLSAAAAKAATSLTVTSKAPSKAWGVGTKVTIAASGIADRNGSVPEPGALTPIKASIAANKVVEVDLTGTVAVLADLPGADGDGFIVLPVGTTQDAANYVAGPDNLPFKVKASDTELDTFAGAVRLVFQVPFSDPNVTAENAGTYPKNGVQKGSAY